MEIMEEPTSAAAAWLDSIASDTAFIAANQHPTFHLLMILAVGREGLGITFSPRFRPLSPMNPMAFIAANQHPTFHVLTV